MGLQCCRFATVETYRPKTWQEAEQDLASVTNLKLEALKGEAGPNGFPFKVGNSSFVKVVMKNRRKRYLHVLTNLNQLKRACGDNDFLIMPKKIVETDYALHMHFDMCDMDLVKYLSIYSVSPNTRDTILGRIVDAVSYLHDHGFVHRDVKLENVVMKKGVPYLCDLDFTTDADLVDFKGTHHYMPPQFVMNTLFSNRPDIENSVKNRWLDCYALGKSICNFLMYSSPGIDKKTGMDIHDLWMQQPQSSFRSVNVNENDLIVRTKWWKVVIAFCKENECRVFEYSPFWTLNDIDTLKS